MHKRALGLAMSAVASAVVMGGLVASPASAVTGIATWTGYGADDNWSTPGNWEGGHVPRANDVVQFPARDSESRHHPYNDLDAATTYDSLKIQGAGYDISGNAISLEYYVTAYYPGSSHVRNDIDMPAGSYVNAQSGTTLYLDGSIGQGFDKHGDGTTVLTGVSYYHGDTTVDEGTLAVTQAGGLGSADDPTVVRDGATLELRRGIETSEVIHLTGEGVNGAGALLQSSELSNVRRVVLDGDASIGASADAYLYVTNALDSVSAGATLTKVGDGVLTVQATPAPGTRAVARQGTLVPLRFGTGSVQSRTGGTVAGQGGNLGTVETIGGTVTAGYNAQPYASRAGSLQLDDASTFVVQVNERDDPFPSPDPISSRLSVDGPVDLGGATLRLDVTRLVSHVGDTYTLITSDTDIAGTFHGLAEGARLTASNAPGKPFSISYRGGPHGHDVVLTRVSGVVLPPAINNPPAADTTAPDTQITDGPAQGSTTSERYGAIAFSSPDTDGASFECSLNNQAFFTCGSPFVLSDLALGPQVFEVRAKDHAGNVDASPALVEWTVVPMPTVPTVPTVPSTPAVPAAPKAVAVSGVTDGGKVYTAAPSTSLTLTGRGTAGAVVTVREGQAVVGTTTVGSDGTWSVRTAGLAAGRHALTATQTVGSATSAPVVVGEVTVEAVRLGLVKSITTTLAERPLVRGSGNPGAKVTVRTTSGRKLGTTTVAPNGTWRIKSPKLKRGTYKVRAIQKIAGTTATSSVVRFHVKRR